MEVVRTVIRSLVVSLAIAAVMLVAVQLSIGVSYSSSMTPEEEESLKAMRYIEAGEFMAEHQEITRGWPALREQFSSSGSRKPATLTLAILALCGFFSSLCVAVWNSRSHGNTSNAIPNKPGGC